MYNTLKEFLEGKKITTMVGIRLDEDEKSHNRTIDDLIVSLPQLLSKVQAEVMEMVGQDSPKEIVLSENYELNGRTIKDWEGLDLFIKGQNVQYYRLRTAITTYLSSNT
jgi:hypothetical protein